MESSLAPLLFIVLEVFFLGVVGLEEVWTAHMKTISHLLYKLHASVENQQQLNVKKGAVLFEVRYLGPANSGEPCTTYIVK